jgi:hypothetical protein
MKTDTRGKDLITDKKSQECNESSDTNYTKHLAIIDRVVNEFMIKRYGISLKDALAKQKRQCVPTEYANKRGDLGPISAHILYYRRI